MKNLFLLLLFAFFMPVTILAQNVLNGSFENWTNGNPDNWYVDNIPTLVLPLTQSTTAHSGSYSIKGTVLKWDATDSLAPLLEAGQFTEGFTISQRFKTVTGFYQFNPVLGDRFKVIILLYKGTTTLVASGDLSISASAPSWTQFSLDLIYLTNDTPDICKLIFSIDGPATGGNAHTNSSFLLDDVVLTGTNTSVNDKNNIPAKFSLEQNFPNPFNPSTKIQYNIPENSFVSLKVYNTIGQEVASLVNNIIPAGSHEITLDASKLNSGVYFYTLKSGNNFVQTRKMILMK